MPKLPVKYNTLDGNWMHIRHVLEELNYDWVNQLVRRLPSAFRKKRFGNRKVAAKWIAVFIIKRLYELAVEDMIYNNTEYVFNHGHKDHFKLRIAEQRSWKFKSMGPGQKKFFIPFCHVSDHFWKVNKLTVMIRFGWLSFKKFREEYRNGHQWELVPNLKQNGS